MHVNEWMNEWLSWTNDVSQQNFTQHMSLIIKPFKILKVQPELVNHLFKTC